MILLTPSPKSHGFLRFIDPCMFVYVLARVSEGEAFAHSMTCMCVCMSYVVCFSRTFPLVVRVDMYVFVCMCVVCCVVRVRVVCVVCVCVVCYYVYIILTAFSQEIGLLSWVFCLQTP